MKDYINIHPNGVVIRTHNKRLVLVDHPKISGAYHIEMTKKQTTDDPTCKFVVGRRNVNTMFLAISDESMRDLILAYVKMKSKRVVKK